MASSLASGFCRFCPCRKQQRKLLKFPQVIRSSSQSPRDEGKSADIVDANLSTLRKRMDEVKKNEMLGKCCRIKHGWDYKPGYDHNHKRADMLYESIQMMGFVGGAIGFVFLSGSLFIYLISFLVCFSKL